MHIQIIGAMDYVHVGKDLVGNPVGAFWGRVPLSVLYCSILSMCRQTKLVLLGSMFCEYNIGRTVGVALFYALL